MGLSQEEGSPCHEAVRLLPSTGTSPPTWTCLSETPLHQAMRVLFSSLPMTEALLAAGADVAARDYSGHTPLHLAASWSYHEGLIS